MTPANPTRPIGAAAFEHGYAVVIGVAGYRALARLPLAALNDAVDLARTLWDPEICGYRADRVRLLLDEQATADGIRQALVWMSDQTSEQDTAIVFFSGHGWQDETGTYLAAYDADSDSPLAGMIPSDEFANRLQAIGAGRLAVFLDCCHAGGAGEIRAGKGARAALGASRLDERTYEKLRGGRGRVLIASSGPEEESTILKGARNSLFTSYLMRGLAGEAPTAKPGILGIFDLYQWAFDRVKKRSGGRQRPLFQGEVRDNFPIALRRVKRGPVPPENTNRKAQSTTEPIVKQAPGKVKGVYVAGNVNELHNKVG
jgi:uncharacterized caspase-like protein